MNKKPEQGQEVQQQQQRAKTLQANEGEWGGGGREPLVERNTGGGRKDKTLYKKQSRKQSSKHSKECSINQNLKGGVHGGIGAGGGAGGEETNQELNDNGRCLIARQQSVGRSVSTPAIRAGFLFLQPPDNVISNSTGQYRPQQLKPTTPTILLSYRYAAARHHTPPGSTAPCSGS